MIHFRHLLNLFFVFPMQYIVNENANDWIRTAELWCQKRPIYHLRHHHIPKRECFLTCLTVLLPPTAKFWHCTVLALHSFGTAQFWHCKVLALHSFGTANGTKQKIGHAYRQCHGLFVLVVPRTIF